MSKRILRKRRLLARSSARPANLAPDHSIAPPAAPEPEPAVQADPEPLPARDPDPAPPPARAADPAPPPAPAVLPGGWRPALIAGAVYAAIALLLWTAHSVYAGLSSESHFAWTSETESWLRGFIYEPDHLRPFTNVFYHLSYLLGEVAGVTGSYVPYQVVYALLWWARAFLVFLLARRFFPRQIEMCFVAGALALVDCSDGAVGWIGQLNQFGFIFWMLLAAYFLIRATEPRPVGRCVLATVLACGFSFLSLWSYESQILLICIFPLALVLAWGFSLRKLAIFAAWYSVPGCYAVLTVRKYLEHRGATYQERVVRKTFGMSGLLSDWWFNITSSLEFWKWPRGIHRGADFWLSITAAAVFVAGGLIAAWYASRKSDADHVAAVRPALLAMAAGFAAVVLSFPVYLLLDTARSLWRTQFLSTPGAGLFLAGLATLFAVKVAPRWWRAVAAIAAAPVVFFGSVGTLARCELHRVNWERQRVLTTAMLRAVPNVRPGAVVIMTGVDRDPDPFGDNLWFDAAVRLAYPGKQVDGMYLYSGFAVPPGGNLKAEGDRWKWDGTGLAPLLLEAPVADTVVVHYDGAGRAHIVPALSPAICRGPCDTRAYHPESVVTGTVSPIAARRYRLGVR